MAGHSTPTPVEMPAIGSCSAHVRSELTFALQDGPHIEAVSDLALPSNSSPAARAYRYIRGDNFDSPHPRPLTKLINTAQFAAFSATGDDDPLDVILSRADMRRELEELVNSGSDGVREH